MKQMVYFVIVFFVLVLSNGMTQFASAQTFPKQSNQKLVIRETKAFSNYFKSKSQGDSEISFIQDDPSDPVTFTYYEDKSQPAETVGAVMVPDRSEGNYYTQVVIVNWTAPGLNTTSPNLVSMPQARSIVFENNGTSVKDYLAEVSNGALVIKSKSSAGGDVFTLNVQLPQDNCDFRLYNEVPAMVNSQLPSGNKFSEVHATYLVFNQAVFQSGGCSYFASANVSPVRSMQMGNLIWIPEDMFTGVQGPNYHEMLHTLGLGHSSMAWSNGSPDPLTWPRLEYGDPACIMGNISRRLNSYQAHKLGWYKPNAPFKELIPGSYYVVAPTEERGIWSKRLFGAQNSYITAKDSANIPNGQRVYPEIRQNRKFDDFYSVTNYRKFASGVSLRWGAADVTAAATNSVLINTAGTFEAGDAPLSIINQPFAIWNIRATLLSPFSAMTGARINFVF